MGDKDNEEGRDKSARGKLSGPSVTSVGWPSVVVLAGCIMAASLCKVGKSMTEIKCPHCGRIDELTDSRRNVLQPKSDVFCWSCGINAPLQKWLCARQTTLADAGPEAATKPKPDSRTAEEKQRDWLDDNLRSEFQ